MLINQMLISVGLIYFVSSNLPNVLVAQSFRQYEKNIKLLDTQVPKSRINLDQLPGEVRYPRLVIGDEDPHAAGPGSLFLANPISAIVLRDSIYICDRKLNAIIVSTMDGQLVRKIGRTGKAPGEFLNPAGIATNGEMVAVYDTQNARVQVFDSHFKYLGSLPAAFPMFVTTLALTKDYLISHGDYTDSLLIKVHELEKPFGLKRAFFPLVVPKRHEASRLNQAVFSANEHGWICAAYDALPYLFVFDPNGNQVHTVMLEGAAVNDLEKPLETGFRSTTGGRAFRTFISALWMENDGAILFARGSDLYVLSSTNRGYVLQRKLSLRYSEQNKVRQSREDTFLIWSIYHTEGTIFVTDRVPLSYPWLLVYDF